MPTETFDQKRGELETYFDRTAVEAWKKLTSNAPVSGIRATVRKGREDMRNKLLSWLPADLHGQSLLDAGAGTCALTMLAAERGAHVTAVDVSQNLIDHAKAALSNTESGRRIAFKVGDMLDSAHGTHDYVVAMDSLIHYSDRDIVEALSALAERTNKAILFTVAPRTLLLTMMHKAGKFFPKSDRSPAIQPVSTTRLKTLIKRHPRLNGWVMEETHRVKSGFYFSEAVRFVKREGAL